VRWQFDIALSAFARVQNHDVPGGLSASFGGDAGGGFGAAEAASDGAFAGDGTKEKHEGEEGPAAAAFLLDAPLQKQIVAADVAGVLDGASTARDGEGDDVARGSVGAAPEGHMRVPSPWLDAGRRRERRDRAVRAEAEVLETDLRALTVIEDPAVRPGELNAFGGGGRVGSRLVRSGASGVRSLAGRDEDMTRSEQPEP
jgi:hypothetical protein